jgi:hypothetical protein
MVEVTLLFGFHELTQVLYCGAYIYTSGHVDCEMKIGDSSHDDCCGARPATGLAAYGEMTGNEYMDESMSDASSVCSTEGDPLHGAANRQHSSLAPTTTTAVVINCTICRLHPSAVVRRDK